MTGKTTTPGLPGTAARPGNQPPRRPLLHRITVDLGPYLLFVAALLLVPFVFTRLSPYTMADGVQMMLLAIAALGLVPLTGYAGQVSLGQAAFYGIGAYTTGVLSVRFGQSIWLSVVIGAVLAGLVAYLLGLALFRAAGHYLTLATIAIGLTLGVVAQQLGITGGGQGLPGVDSISLFGIDVSGDVNFFYLAAALLLIGTAVVRLVCRSSFARTLLAISDSAIAAQSCGVDPAPMKRSMFVLAAVTSSVAGSLYATWSGYVDASTLDLTVSLQLLIIVTVGGRRSVFGATVGAFVVVSLVRFAKEWLPAVSSHAGGQVEIIAYGLALILVLRLLPRGIVGGVSDLARRLVPASWR